MLYSLKGVKPIIGKNCYIADTASIIGNVVIGDNVNITFGAVLRGDAEPIIVGSYSNVQDNCTLHVNEKYPVKIGERVTIGHNSVVHGCTIGDNSVIGMGAMILNGAVIPANCLVAAGSVVTPKLEAKEGVLIAGSPAKVVRELSEDNLYYLKTNYLDYVEEIELYNKYLKKIEE